MDPSFSKTIVTPKAHVPPLDGVRALAILGVLAFHILAHYQVLGLSLPPVIRIGGTLGQTGVDLFFVLSGFLITGILIDTHRDPHRVRNFYVRRSLRIFPLYFFTIFVVYNLAPRFFGQTTCSQHQIWAWLYLTNVSESFSLAPAVFGHFWSLAVEEQFYLVWPFLIWRCHTLRQITLVAWTTIGIAFLTRWLLSGLETFPAFFTLCRVDAMAAGALVAAYGRLATDEAIWRRWALLAVGLVLVVSAPLYLLFSGSGSPFLQVFKFSLIAAVYGCFLATVVSLHPQGLLTRWLSCKPLTLIGKHSYALYVFHPFVITLADKIPLPESWSETASEGIRCFLVVALSFIASLISWWALERPFLKLKNRFSSHQTVASVAHQGG